MKKRYVVPVMAMLALSSFGEVVSTSETLKGLGFKDTSYLYVEKQTLSDKISGDLNIQAGREGTGGAVVTIGRCDNDFTGGTYVKSGTLVVPSLGLSYLATALGYTRTASETVGAPIVIAQGTLKIQGSGMTDRDLALWQDSNQTDRSGTIWVDANAEAIMTGCVLQPREKFGNLIKRGAGTFTLATSTAGAVNRIGRVSSISKEDGMLSQTDGNFPTSGYTPFTIADGRFVIDTAATVTNYLNHVRIGCYTTDDAGAETAGHLEIRNGVNFICGGVLHLGLRNGNTTTAPTPLKSSLDIVGGETVVTGLVRMVHGWSEIANSTAKPEINVSGGSLKLKNTLYLNNSTSRGRISVSGGLLECANIIVGDNVSGSTLDIDLSDSGTMTMTGALQYGRNTDAYGTISIADNALLRLPRLTSTDYSRAHEDLAMDGGTFAVVGGETNTTANLFGRNFLIGEKGATIDVTDCSELGPNCRFTITSAEGVAVDGGLVIRNRGPFKRSFQFFSPVSCTGVVRAEGNVVLKVCGTTYSTTFKIPAEAGFGARITNDSAAEMTATVKSLVYPDALGRLEVGFSSGTPKCWKTVVTDSFIPPTETFSVGFYATRELKTTAAPLGTWDILDFPSSVSFDVSKCRAANTESDRSYVFSIVENGDVKTLRVTIGETASFAEADTIDVSSDVTIATTRDFWTGVNKTISGEGALTIADGAYVRFNHGVTFGMKTLNLSGGRIETASPFADGVTGNVNWNGTVIYPTTRIDENEIFKAYSDSSSVRIALGETGGVIDTSLMECNWLLLYQRMSGSGTITVRGMSTEKSVHLRGFRYSAADYPTTIDFRAAKGGCISLYGDNFKNHTLTVADGGAVGSNDRGDIKVLKLGETASDVVSVYANFNPKSSPQMTERVRVLGTLMVNGTVKVGFRSSATSGDYTAYELCCPTNGRWRVLEAPKNSIDLTKFTLDPVVCAGKRGVFDVEQGSADVLYVTISDSEESARVLTYPTTTCAKTHTWTGGSGDFETVANWDVAPELKGEAENLVFAPSEDIVVSHVADLPVASLVQNAATSVTLSGGSTVFKSDATFDIPESTGSLVLAGDVFGNGSLTMSRTSGAGKLTIAGAVRDALVIRKDSGYIEGRPCAFGQAALHPYNATVKFLGSGVFSGDIIHGGIDTTGVAVDVAEGETVRMTGTYTSYSLLSKMGGGTFHLQSSTQANLGNSKKTEGTPLFPANGDAPNGQTFNVFAGRMVLDCDTSLSGETRIGPTPIVKNGTSTAYDAELVVLSGMNALRNVSVGKTFNYTYTDYTTFATRPRRFIRVLGGTLSCRSFIMGQSASGANNDAGYNRVTVEGGTLRMTDSDAEFAVGYDGDQTSKVTKDGQGNENVLTVNGGVVERSTGGTIGIGWGLCGDVGFRPCRGTINVNGGILRTTAGKIDLAHNKNGVDKETRGHAVGTLNLNGGRVEAGCLTRTCSYLCETTVNLNGGTLALLGSAGSVDAAIPSLNVCAGGAMFEVDGAATVSSPLVHAAALEDEPDGGLVKTGAGTLTISAATSFDGPVEVREGTLALSAAAGAISALRVDMNADSSARITGFRTNAGAVLYVDNYEGRMRGTVELPLSVEGEGSFAAVYVNGVLASDRRATVKNGKLVCCGKGLHIIIR